MEESVKNIGHKIPIPKALPGEYIEFEVADVIIARQINGVLQRVRLIAHTELVHFVQLIPELFPGHNCPIGSK